MMKNWFKRYRAHVRGRNKLRDYLRGNDPFGPRNLDAEKEENRDLAQFMRHGFEREGFQCLTHKDHLQFHPTKCDWIYINKKGNDR